MAIILLMFCASCDLEPAPDDIKNPTESESSFLITDSRAPEAVRILETSDVFLVFSRFAIYEIGKSNGEILTYLDLTSSIDNYFFADVWEFKDGSFLIVSTNGEFTFMDEELNLYTSNRNTPFSEVYAIYADQEEEIFLIAGAGPNAMVAPFIFFWPEGTFPNVFAFTGYTTHFIGNGISYPPPNHLILQNKALFPIIKSGTPTKYSLACYTRSNPSNDWITDFDQFDPRGMASFENGDILAYGKENGNSRLYTLNGPNGIPGSSLTICENNAEVPGHIITTSDGGFAVISTVLAQNGNCTTALINGVNDIRLIKLNESLQTEWEQVYSIDLEQQVYFLIQTDDEGFAFAGRSRKNGIDQLLFIKTDADGNLIM